MRIVLTLTESYNVYVFLHRDLAVTICGNQQEKDPLFSGHTLIMTAGAATVDYYAPDRFKLLRHVPKLFMIVGMICVSISHTHYVVDICIGWWLTAFLFW